MSFYLAKNIFLKKKTKFDIHCYEITFSKNVQASSSRSCNQYRMFIQFVFLNFGNRNSIPPTTTVSNLLEKQKATSGKICVDVGFWGGIIPSNANDLRALHEAGVFGFKCFLHPSGDETFPFVTEDDVELACQQLTDSDALIAVAFHFDSIKIFEN